MTTQIHLWVIGLFFGIWLIELVRQRQIGCLFISLALWLAVATTVIVSISIYENFFLYQIFGLLGLGFPLHFVHFFILLGSVILLFRQTQKLPERHENYRLISPLLSLFATSSVVMHLSALTLWILMNFAWNQPNHTVFLTRLANMYFLNPVQWYAWQGLLMLIFFLHRQWIMRESPAIFSTQQIQAGFLMILPLQFFYVVNGSVWLLQIIRFILRN